MATVHPVVCLWPTRRHRMDVGSDMNEPQYVPSKPGYTTIRRLRIYTVIAVMVVAATVLWHSYGEAALGRPTLPQEATAGTGSIACTGGWKRVSQEAAYREQPLADALYRCPDNGAELMHAKTFSKYGLLYHHEKFLAVDIRRLDGGWVYVR